MMEAFAIVDVALHIAAAIATYFWVKQRLEKHQALVAEEVKKVPVLAPDPRVDDLVRVVSTLKGAEALKQVFGKAN